jgi:hypothetical protein
MKDFSYWLERTRTRLAKWEIEERLDPGAGNRQRAQRLKRKRAPESSRWEYALAFVLPVPIIAYDAFVLTKLWAWFFVATFSAHPLPWSTACGLLTASSLVVANRSSGAASKTASQQLLISLTYATVLWALGAIFHFVF